MEGKYQDTYFMVFKCHFGSNIDFLMEAELWVLQHGTECLPAPARSSSDLKAW